jgi:hypothetical protein
VNYVGHGSTALWAGNLLTASDVRSLTNKQHLPLVISMTCLNAYFQDPVLEGLGETWLKVNNGGAIAVFASTGMTDSGNQSVLNQSLYQFLFNGQTMTIGQAIRQAKSQTPDDDVKRTWVLLGDPTMRLK